MDTVTLTHFCPGIQPSLIFFSLALSQKFWTCIWVCSLLRSLFFCFASLPSNLRPSDISLMHWKSHRSWLPFSSSVASAQYCISFPLGAWDSFEIWTRTFSGSIEIFWLLLLLLSLSESLSSSHTKEPSSHPLSSGRLAILDAMWSLKMSLDIVEWN